jgi:hypothetical protein
MRSRNNPTNRLTKDAAPRIKAAPVMVLVWAEKILENTILYFGTVTVRIA